MNTRFLFALPVAAILIISAGAQQTAPSQSGNDSVQTGISSLPANSNSSEKNDDLGARQPLQPDTHQGFWGKMNPFARKKYVQRQMEPIRNRVNELDELTASNTKMLKDVDARATEGIRLATLRANEADQHALAAGQRAQQAHETASQANTRLQAVSQVVGNIDQYQSTNQTEIRFRAGQTTLSKSSKDALDQLVANTKDQKGYILQIQGFSPGRGQAAIQNSQAMAQSVSRYLVIEHQIPVYRIFVVGMGNAQVASADGKSQHVHGGRVEISLLKNGVDQLTQTASSSGASSLGGTTGAASDVAPWQRNNAQQPSSTSQPAR